MRHSGYGIFTIEPINLHLTISYKSNKLFCCKVVKITILYNVYNIYCTYSLLQDVTTHNKVKSCFHLVTPSRIYELYAHDQSERTAWMEGKTHEFSVCSNRGLLLIHVATFMSCTHTTSQNKLRGWKVTIRNSLVDLFIIVTSVTMIAYKTKRICRQNSFKKPRFLEGYKTHEYSHGQKKTKRIRVNIFSILLFDTPNDN